MIAPHSALSADPEPWAAVVTGAAVGIGAAISRRLCEHGWNVVGLGRSASTLNRTCAGLRGLPGSFAGVVGDVRCEDDVAKLFETTVAEFGRVCAVVSNSGIAGPTAPVADTNLADWQAVIATNLTGAFLTVRAAVPYLRQAGWGRIVLISSTTGKNPVAGRSAYAASRTPSVSTSGGRFLGLGLLESASAAVASGVVEHTVEPAAVDHAD
ncbi:MAG: SDR family NAD(P)-dependent oxidoreductase, partial [Egibacteraceae bacterium]